MKYYLGWVDKHGDRQFIRTGKKRRISGLVVREKSSEWTLRVIYQGGKDPIKNEGVFYKKCDVLKCLADWSDKDIIKYATEGDWTCR